MIAREAMKTGFGLNHYVFVGWLETAAVFKTNRGLAHF